MNSGQFKFKPDKIKYLTNVHTLDSSHNKIIDTINKKRINLPKKEKKLEKLKMMLKELDENATTVDNYVYLKSKIIEEVDGLSNDINEINNYDDEINYFSKTYDILFNYYDQYDGIVNNTYNPHTLVKNNNDVNIVNNVNIGNDVNDVNIVNDINDVNDVNIVNIVNDVNDVNIVNIVNNVNDDNNDKDNNDGTNCDTEINDTLAICDINEDGELSMLFKKKDKIDKLELLNQLSKLKRKEKKCTRKRIKNIESLVKDNNNNIFNYLDKGKNDISCIKTSSNPDAINPNDTFIATPNPSIPVRLYDKSTPPVIPIYQDKASLFEEFRLVIEGMQTQKKINKFCTNCNIDKILIYSEGTYTCMNCGEVESCIVESDITSYKDPMIEKPTFPYKRKNHFCEWILYLNCSLKYIPLMMLIS
jgi:hypothetical protein